LTIFFDYYFLGRYKWSFEDLNKSIERADINSNHKKLGRVYPTMTNVLVKEKKMSKQKNSKFMQPMAISKDLAAIVGKGPMPRTEVTKKLWDYIKANKRQDPKNKRNIIPDDKLARVLGKKAINMFEMTKAVSKHLS